MTDFFNKIGHKLSVESDDFEEAVDRHLEYGRYHSRTQTWPVATLHPNA